MSSTPYNYYLWKAKVNDAGVRFVRNDDLPSFGFRSVYAVDQASAETLSANEDITAFKGIVYESKLWIDCDTEEAARTVEAGLREMGLGFEKWTTGNRGAHFGVERVAKPSQLLPMRDKAWVKAHFPCADLRLYTHLHMFRCPGAIHEKTGNRKERLFTVEGKVLQIEEGVYVDSTPEIEPTETDREFGSAFSDPVIMPWTTPQSSGLRNKALSTVAYRFAERGEKPEFTLRWLEHLNLLFEEPKDHTELEKIVRYAYQRRGER